MSKFKPDDRVVIPKNKWCPKEHGVVVDRLKVDGLYPGTLYPDTYLVLVDVSEDQWDDRYREVIETDMEHAP